MNRFGVKHISRDAAKVCYWCGVTLCHRCRQGTEDKPAKCEGHRMSLCPRAATRDHLIPRTIQKSRRKHSGYRNPPPSVVACRECNNRRGALPVEEWCQQLDGVAP